MFELSFEENAREFVCKVSLPFLGHCHWDQVNLVEDLDEAFALLDSLFLNLFGSGGFRVSCVQNLENYIGVLNNFGKFFIIGASRETKVLGHVLFI